MASHSIIGGDGGEEEAAALAAVVCLLEEEAAAAAGAAPAPARPGWRDAARLVVQGLVPVRPAAAASWGRVERSRRAGRGGTGIVGL